MLGSSKFTLLGLRYNMRSKRDDCDIFTPGAHHRSLLDYVDLSQKDLYGLWLVFPGASRAICKI